MLQQEKTKFVAVYWNEVWRQQHGIIQVWCCIVVDINGYGSYNYVSYIFVLFFATVLDVEAFERLLGPCMNIMKRNIDDYEDQLVRIFGSKTNITDIRWKHYVGSYSPECTYFQNVLSPLLFILISDMSF